MPQLIHPSMNFFLLLSCTSPGVRIMTVLWAGLHATA